jgi:hypothetical protein
MMQSFIDSIEKLFARVYFYFSQFGKKAFELERLVVLSNVKGLKIHQNVKTRWLSMFSLAKKILAKYKALIIQM